MSSSVVSTSHHAGYSGHKRGMSERCLDNIEMLLSRMVRLGVQEAEQSSGARPGLQFEHGELWKELVAKYLQTSRGMLEGSFWMISEHICAG